MSLDSRTHARLTAVTQAVVLTTIAEAGKRGLNGPGMVTAALAAVYEVNHAICAGTGLKHAIALGQADLDSMVQYRKLFEELSEIIRGEGLARIDRCIAQIEESVGAHDRVTDGGVVPSVEDARKMFAQDEKK